MKRFIIFIITMIIISGIIYLSGITFEPETYFIGLQGAALSTMYSFFLTMSLFIGYELKESSRIDNQLK